MFKLRPVKHENDCEHMFRATVSLTILALGYSRVRSESSEERHDSLEDFGRHVREGGCSLLNALVAERRCVDSAVVGVYESGESEPKVIHAENGHFTWRKFVQTDENSRRLCIGDPKEALNRAIRSA